MLINENAVLYRKGDTLHERILFQKDSFLAWRDPARVLFPRAHADEFLGSRGRRFRFYGQCAVAEQPAARLLPGIVRHMASAAVSRGLRAVYCLPGQAKPEPLQS
ncbi:hypothetical protein D1872_303230 [compost metagenome]